MTAEAPNPPAPASRRSRFVRFLIRASVVVLIVLPVALVGYRGYELLATPDVAEPFDVEAFAAYSLPDERNAFVNYRKASELLLRPAALAITDQDLFPRNGDTLTPAEQDWEKASPAIRRWLEANRDALDELRNGAVLAECLPFTMTQVTGPDPLAFDWRGLQQCARLKSFEGAQLAAAGRFAAAWDCYRDLLRMGRHLSVRAPLNSASTGSWIIEVGADDALAWSSKKGVTASDLKQAIRDVLAIEKMPAPASDRIKVEYLALRQFVETGTAYGETMPSWMFWTGYPAQMSRTCRLVVANLLTQADRPRILRAPVHPGELEIYELDPAAPPDPRLRPPAEIERSAVTSARLLGEALSRVAPTYSPDGRLAPADLRMRLLRVAIKMQDGCAQRLDALLLVLALELHHREQGGFPASLDDLVRRGYLKSIPLDPYGKGEAFRYRREPDLKNGAVVWSIGPDGIDDGGDPDRYDDITVRVHVPGSQPPPPT